MKITKNKGFSLAEVMIAMLIVSIALAAAIPTITKRNAGSDIIWQMGSQKVEGESVQDTSAISYTGPNLLLGVTRLQSLGRVNDYFVGYRDRVNDFNFLPKTDKLVIFNVVANQQENAHSFFASSHMSFYNQAANRAPVYAGRLASDKYNMALGIGTLQSVEPEYTNISDLHGAFNIAFGHYAMLTNMQGSFNTAFGYRALQGTVPKTPHSVGNRLQLRNNVLAVEKNYGNRVNTQTSANVAIGDSALEQNNGSKNVAIGSNAGKHLQGDNNIIIGAGAGNLLKGHNNILITTIHGYDPKDADTQFDVKKLLIGKRVKSDGSQKFPMVTDDDNFVIGMLNQPWEDGRSGVKPPMIQGFTQTRCRNDVCNYSANTDIPSNLVHTKGLIINADEFSINNAYGTQAIFGVYTNNKNADAINLWNSKTPPCKGAPICIAKFNTPKGTYINNECREGFDEDGECYHPTETTPEFLGPGTSSPNKYTPWNPSENPNISFDLYIGSIFHDFNILSETSEDFAFNNNISSVVDKDRKLPSCKVDTAAGEIEPDYCRFPEMHLQDGDVYRLIDVGQARHSTGLKSVNGVINLPYDKEDPFSLKIKTVRAAVNFLEEFKETKTWFDRMNMNMDDVFNCLFNSGYDPSKPAGENMINCVNSTESLGGVSGDAAYQIDPVQALFCEFMGLKETVPLLCSQKMYDFVQDLKSKVEDFANKVEDFFKNLFSDARLKNIQGDSKAGLKEIKKLQVYNYTYKADKEKTPHVGVMAQDLKRVFPDAVKKAPDGYYRIRLEDMFYAMVNSVQELSTKKDDLEALTIDYIDTPLSELEKQNADIMAQNELLKQRNAEMEKHLSALESK